MRHLSDSIKTMTKTLYDLNKAYICVRLNISDLNVKRYSNYSFMQKGIARAGVVYRYARDVKVGKSGYSILLLSEIDNPDQVEQFFKVVEDSIRFTVSDLKNLSIIPVPTELIFTGDN